METEKTEFNEHGSDTTGKKYQTIEEMWKYEIDELKKKGEDWYQKGGEFI
jgi:hypothetical protein